MPDVDWEKVAESLDEFVALRENELTAIDVTVPSRPAVVVGWRAEALAEIIAAARWGLEAQQRGERVWWCEECMLAAKYRSDLACPHADALPEALLVPLEGEQ